MKNKGYTLAEILIAMAIIGIVAAVMLPMANKYKPDGIKAMYIFAHDAVVEAVQAIASNSTAYPIVSNDGTLNYEDVPLYNTVAVNVGGGSYGGSNAKFCELLASSMNTIGGTSCLAEYKTYSDSTFSPSFVTTNGVQFFVTSQVTATTYKSDIYFDVNGAKNPNCIYSSSCPNPDRFKLMVAANGAVVIADPYGENFLATRTNLKHHTPEIASGATVAEELPADLKSLKPEALN